MRLAQRNGTQGRIPSDYAALIGATLLAELALPGCGCLACSPTGYMTFPGALGFVHGEQPTEFGAGLSCDIGDQDGRR